MTMLLAFLAFFTMGAVAFFAYRSAQESYERSKDPNAPKSTLASDTPDTFEGRPPDTHALLDLIPYNWRKKGARGMAHDAGQTLGHVQAKVEKAMH